MIMIIFFRENLLYIFNIFFSLLDEPLGVVPFADMDDSYYNNPITSTPSTVSANHKKIARGIPIYIEFNLIIFYISRATYLPFPGHIFYVKVPLAMVLFIEEEKKM